MRNIFTVFLTVFGFTVFLVGCCGSSTSTVTTMRDTTVTGGGLSGSAPLLQLDNFSFVSAGKDSSGDTTWTVRITFDTLVSIYDTVWIINPQAIVNSMVNCFTPKKKVGTTTVTVKPQDIPVKYPQTVTTTNERRWYDDVINKVLLFLGVIFIIAIIVRRVLQ